MTNSNKFPKFPLREYMYLMNEEISEKEVELVTYLNQADNLRMLVNNNEISYNKTSIFFSFVDCLNNDSKHNIVISTDKTECLVFINKMCRIVKQIKEASNTMYPMNSMCLNWEKDVLFDPKYYNDTEFRFYNGSRLVVVYPESSYSMNISYFARPNIYNFVFAETDSPSQKLKSIRNSLYSKNIVIKSDFNDISNEFFVFK